MMCLWQEIYAYKFTWAKGEFDTAGNLTGVMSKSYSVVSGRRKIMVPEGNNLGKYEGKKTCKTNSDQFPHLKKGGETYVKCDCKHL